MINKETATDKLMKIKELEAQIHTLKMEIPSCYSCKHCEEYTNAYDPYPPAMYCRRHDKTTYPDDYCDRWEKNNE